MKKFQFWSLLLGLTFGSLAFTGCSSDSDDPTPTPTPNPTPTTHRPKSGDPDNMKFAHFYGTVTKSGWTGGALAGVTVTSGSKTTTSDGNGFYQLDEVNVVDGRAVVRFEREGFMPVVRTVAIADNDRLDVMMVEITNEQSFNADNGTSMMVTSSGKFMTVVLPSGYTVDGKAYDGQVTAKSVFLSPDENNFANQMPGDLSAVRTDNSAAQLVSYGMVAVELTGSNGEKLELAEGKTATLKFPVPDRYADNPPATIPLWSFNESTGKWEEEGEAKLTNEYGLLYYIGQVSHFSWHNLDTPLAKAELTVTVKDSKGNLLPNVPVDIDGQRMFYTNANGVMKCDVPSEVDFYVRIPSESYGNYAYDDPSLDKKEMLNLEGGSSKSITFTIPVSAPVIKGAVTNTAGSNICSVYIVYGWETTAAVQSDLNGAYRIYAPVNYRGAATLVARFANGVKVEKNITITDSNQTIDLYAEEVTSSGAGMFHVSRADLGLDAVYALPTSQTGGLFTAEIKDGVFSVMGTKFLGSDENDRQGAESLQFAVDNYTASATSFKSWSFVYMKEAGPHFSLMVQNYDGDPDAAVQIVKVGNLYNIKITNVTADFSDQMSGIEWENVKADIEFSVNAK